jgi:hypothetical protein
MNYPMTVGTHLCTTKMICHFSPKVMWLSTMVCSGLLLHKITNNSHDFQPTQTTSQSHWVKCIALVQMLTNKTPWYFQSITVPFRCCRYQNVRPAAAIFACQNDCHSHLMLLLLAVVFCSFSVLGYLSVLVSLVVFPTIQSTTSLCFTVFPMSLTMPLVPSMKTRMMLFPTCI